MESRFRIFFFLKKRKIYIRETKFWICRSEIIGLTVRVYQCVCGHALAKRADHVLLLNSLEAFASHGMDVLIHGRPAQRTRVG